MDVKSKPVDIRQPLALALISVRSPAFADRLKRKLLSGPIFGGAYGEMLYEQVPFEIVKGEDGFNFIRNFIFSASLSGSSVASALCIFRAEARGGNARGVALRQIKIVFGAFETVSSIYAVLAKCPVQRQNLGYNKDNVIYFDVEGRVKESPETFLSEIKKIPGIESAASSTHDMVGHAWATGLNWEGKETDDYIPVQIMAVNPDFLETLGMEMKEGRFFSRDFGTDTSKVIFNEAAIEVMGFDNPIGRTVMGREILGVVKNFHFESFHVDVKPQLFTLHGKNFAPPSLIMTRIEAGKEAETLELLHAFYKSYNPGFPFEYTFLDDVYQREYISEQRVSVLSRYFAGLAILISCLGLFGLAAFTAQRRIKEIGIRKILGASDYGIVRLLTADFTRIVLLAMVIGLPISYYASATWLEQYAYRVDLEWWFFGGAGLATLLIAWFTVGLQTFKAARINPTQCLKEE